MEDKLLKVLKIKIDAINRNIDNLNYLNGELERNNEDLEYIETNISLFKDSEVLNFDNISKEDFDKILTMVDPSITEIFKDKTCNYDGIIYIIQGIRQSISLQLTSEQTSAIYSFIEGMREKSLNLRDTIANLTESKKRLPEIDLTILSSNLDNYQNIVSKFENNLYLTEIDDIGEALDFANVPIEEKADIYEYILKYNANIYSLKGNDNFDVTDKKEDKETEFKFDLPKFDYDTVDINYNPLEVDNEDTNRDAIETADTTLDDIKFDLNTLNINNNQDSNLKNDTIQIPIVNTELPDFNTNLETPAFNDEFANINQMADIDNKLETEETNELNTVELEDIIKKIDAKLKEMETEENKENNTEEIPVQTIEESTDKQLVEPDVDMLAENKYDTELNNTKTYEDISSTTNNQTSLEEVFGKYAIPSLNINKDASEVELMLQSLNDAKLLDDLKRDKGLLTMILSNNTNASLEEIYNLIKENLIVKADEFEDILYLVMKTMPILFTNNDVLNSFKANLMFFKEKNINIINLFDNYRELLIVNNEILKENFNKVMTYGLEINNDNVKYFLYNKNVLNNIDYYIEAIGYEKGFLGKEEYFDGIEYIKKNPYKINNISKDMLMKLRFASENNGKIYGNKPGILSGEITNPKVDIITLTPEYINSYFNSEYGFVDQSELMNLKNEINELKDFDMTYDGNINKLDSEYKQDDLRYKIGNVIISRIKTIRLYNVLKNKLPLKDALLVALTYNSVLKNDEYQNIESVVNSIIGG